jgi:hypothetical protein
MELDQPHLQLIFNVIAMTAISTLAAICYLLKRDNQELSASQLNPLREREPQPPKSLAPPPISKPQHAARQVATPQRGVDAPPKPEAPPARSTDICRFVSQRAQNWVAPSESQWKTP